MNRWGCHLDKVNVSGSVANSHYEKFLDGRVVCIDNEIPFEIPQRWEWTRLGDVFELRSGQDFPSEKYSSNPGGTLYLTGASNLDGEKILENRWTKTPSVIAPFGSLLLVCKGSGVGKMCMMNLPEAHIARQLQAIIPISQDIDIRIIQIALECRIQEITQKANGVIPGIAREAVLSFLLPIPPLNEQERILDKVLKLSPLVERYREKQQTLEILNCDIRERLKKSILQEAIQGKLVPQDPTDEPASILLERIRVDKQKLLKEGKLKKKDLVDSVIFRGEDNKYYEKVDGKTLEISEEIPFDIPESWAWVRLGSVVTNEAGLAYSKDCLTDRSQPLIRVLRGGNIEEGRWSIKDDDVIISKKYVKDSLLLKRGTFITPAVTSIERMAKTALIQEDHHDIVVGGFVLMIKPVIIDNALLQYLNLFFQSTYYKKYCISITNKSGQAFFNLSRQKLMQCLVPIPPEKEQFRIADKYSQLTL